MIASASSIVMGIWTRVVWVFAQISKVVIFFLNLSLFPQARTRQPSAWTLTLWFAVNLALFTYCAWQMEGRLQLYAATALAVTHFLIIVAALLVITEENDVWNGYVRWDRVGSVDNRIFKRGRIAKSLPLMAISGASYICFSAVAVKAWHSENKILSLPYDAHASILAYIATVGAQIPAIETLLKWAHLQMMAMEFEGIQGIAIKNFIEVSNVSIIVGAINSYFRQKGEVRRLVEALGSGNGNIPVLQAQAARAPEEIKSSILNMALTDISSRVRWRAMTVALHANVLTFPTTMIYNLHRERKEANKQHALSVSKQIIERNFIGLDGDYITALRGKIDFQLQRKRKNHTQKTIEMLFSIQRLVDCHPRLERRGDGPQDP
jgi:hypothetical protein